MLFLKFHRKRFSATLYSWECSIFSHASFANLHVLLHVFHPSIFVFYYSSVVVVVVVVVIDVII